MKQTTAKPNRNRTNMIVDSVIFLGFLLVLAPHFTGMAVHEWLGISLAAGVMTHLLLHWQWLVEVTKRFLRSAQWSARVNYIVNALLFIDVVIILFSGLLISESALPLLGIQLAAGGIWKTLHVTSANLFMLLMGLHVALHWQWIVNMIKRVLPASRHDQKLASAAVAIQKEA